MTNEEFGKGFVPSKAPSKLPPLKTTTSTSQLFSQPPLLQKMDSQLTQAAGAAGSDTPMSHDVSVIASDTGFSTSTGVARTHNGLESIPIPNGWTQEHFQKFVLNILAQLPNENAIN